MSNIINVQIAHQQQYAVHVEQGLEQAFAEFCNEQFSGNKIFVIIDENVNELHRSRIQGMCHPVFSDIHLLEVPEGEASKSLPQWQELVNRILEAGVERNTPVLTAGGGVTGDLGGYVAASVLRGLPLIHMPTTLLAMVDSSIGGKTGINHVTGKNLIGAFYQPEAVFSDIAFLETLEQQEWITGMAEILKYAAIRKPGIFEKLKILAEESFNPNKKWEKVICQSAHIKADIVQEDVLESGKRAYLNFGHTFGHALEKVAGYGRISHGEAVFVGMIAATYFSGELGYPVDDTLFESFMPLYQQQMESLPTDIEELVGAMKSDKKVKNKKLRLVLLNEWGSPYIYHCSDFSKLHDAWRYTLAQFN